MEQQHELAAQALRVIEEIRHDQGFSSDNQLAQHLDINSAFLTHLKKGNLRPRLYRRLIDLGLMREPPPTVSIPVPTAALIFAVAKFPRVRLHKKVERSPRISIQKADPRRAALSILNGMEAVDVQLLIDHLIEGTS